MKPNEQPPPPAAETMPVPTDLPVPEEAAAAAPPTPAAGAPPPDPMAELRAQVADLTEKYLRARADFDNYRKRMQRDLQEIRIQERLAVAREFLAVMDHFQMAQEQFDKGADPAVVKQGFTMIHQQFKGVLGGLGIEPLVVEGQPFDPRQHEAVTEEPSAELPAGTVLRQWKAGYRCGETLLRPAMVVVSSGPAAGAAAPQHS